MKTLSVKTYLFILVASLLLITLVFQLLLINMVKSRMLEEVDTKTLALSRQTLKFITSQQGANTDVSTQPIVLPETVALPTRFRIKIDNVTNHLIPINDDYGLLMGQGSKQISVEQLPPRTFTVNPVKLSNVAANGFVLSQQQNDGIRQRLVQFKQDESAIQGYFNDLIWGLLIISAIALFSAFLVAHHISQPFRQLLGGFAKLAKGLFGAKLTPPQPFAPREAHAAVSGFNQMSDTLQQLDELKSKLKQQQQTLELGDVGRGLAHSLRNPLNTIGLAVEQLALDSLGEDKKADLANQVRLKIKHMDKQIQSLLSLSGSNRGELSEVILQDALNDILLETAGMGPPATLDFPENSVILFANPIELRAILHAPIINALEASSDVPLHIGITPIDNGATVTIADGGPGINPAILPQLFEPHVTDKPEGAGMGLYIAKRLCSSFYQGDISIDNTHPGCRVSITLHNGELDHD